MNNRDRTQENANIIRKLYLNTKPAIISSVKKIVTNALQELATEEFEQTHSTEKKLAFRKNIVEQIVQEFNFFMATRAKEDSISNIDNESNIYSKYDENYQREQKTLEELEKLLNTAEKIEIKKNSISQKISTIVIRMIIIFIVYNSIVFLGSNYSYNKDLIVPIAITFTLIVSLEVYNCSKFYKEYIKEKRALNKIVGTIQEVLPYHLKDMTVLAKANFEVRLARMNISVTGSES